MSPQGHYWDQVKGVGVRGRDAVGEEVSGHSPGLGEGSSQEAHGRGKRGNRPRP